MEPESLLPVTISALACREKKMLIILLEPCRMVIVSNQFKGLLNTLNYRSPG